ncbi:hypothetical protein Clacol_003215 [Clathrus columnatus]|uniref:DUF427 domain-containing protein n=1 Tax=Clathrus columnatus TaxID=1419009 RepID=A0AAV5A8C7_9AGAM|nr:hypothetical protein Clacol_003215 [Clathrus columnatus]
MGFFSLPHVENSLRRIRVFHEGVYLVDSKNAKLVWLHADYPYYWFPESELPKDYLKPTQLGNKDVTIYDLVLGSQSREPQEVIRHHHTGKLTGLFTIEFDKVDMWFEEDEEILVHPKDPYKRADVLQSKRHVRIEVNGVEIANTTSPKLLFETSLPVRTYIPKTDCRLDLLKPSTLKTSCPYKGEASYYHVQTPSGLVEDIVWWHPITTLDILPIKGYVAFYDEKVDVWVDGVKQERPELKE